MYFILSFIAKNVKLIITELKSSYILFFNLCHWDETWINECIWFLIYFLSPKLNSHTCNSGVTVRIKNKLSKLVEKAYKYVKKRETVAYRCSIVTTRLSITNPGHKPKPSETCNGCSYKSLYKIAYHYLYSLISYVLSRFVFLTRYHLYPSLNFTNSDSDSVHIIHHNSELSSNSPVVGFLKLLGHNLEINKSWRKCFFFF